MPEQSADTKLEEILARLDAELAKLTDPDERLKFLQANLPLWYRRE